MNDLPRQMLRQILAKYGKEIYRDVRRCENLLKDSCGSHRREINVLVNAIEQRVPLDLLAANRSMPLELLLTRLEKQLEAQTALTAEATRWAVESWALALNLMTESEIQTRQERSKSVAPPISKIETVQPNDSADGGKIPNINRRNPVLPPKIPSSVPQSRINPPTIKKPIQTSNPSPPVIFPTNNQPANSPPVQMQTMNQTAAARKGFGLFRSCLLIIFLIIITSVVFFFGVPFAIEVMRETQRERNNEPSRFPVR